MIVETSRSDTTGSFGFAANDVLRARSSLCVSSPHT
jgi:hypothetical protein